MPKVSRPVLIAVILTLIATSVVVSLFWYQIFKVLNEAMDHSKDNEKIVSLEKDNATFRTLSDALLTTVSLWHKIGTDKLTGFSPKITLNERSTANGEHCKDGASALRESNKYLRVEGALCGVGYWLEDSSGLKIDSIEKLTNRFGPVETAAEAVSFVSNTQADLKIDNGVPEGSTLTIKNGFLVQLVRKNTFGCGSHQPSKVIFKVTKIGEIKAIAFEGPNLTNSPSICAD